MKPAHIAGMIGITVLGYLVNAKLNIINAELGRLLVASGAVIAITYYFATKDGYSGYSDNSKDSIKPEEALEEVQNYLENSRGKNKLYLSSEDFERENIHEASKWANINGEEKQVYAVVGRPQHPHTGEPLYSEMIRVIWNCTDNSFISYDGEIPMKMGAKTRLNPWEGRENLVINSGRPAKDQKENRSDQEIYINSSNTGKTSSSNTEDDEDDEEDLHGDTYKE